MGCNCCKMIKSYIYDPSVAVEGRKSDPAVGSLYQPQRRAGHGGARDQPGPKQKQGFHNLGYSRSSDSTLKLEADNNHVNRLQGVLPRQPDGDGPYIIQPGRGPSQVPLYPSERALYGGGQPPPPPEETQSGWERPASEIWRSGSGSLSADDVDKGVGGTPEYPCDTGDEGSALSVDVHTSTTSVSSADDAKDGRQAAQTPEVESGISVARGERAWGGDADSVTDSMVAEALAALEAATAGEDTE